MSVSSTCLAVTLLALLAPLGVVRAESRALDRIRADGQLRIATSPGIAPMVFLQNDELVGFDVDFGNRLAERLGLEPRWQISRTHNELTTGIRTGEYSNQADIVISAMGINLERTQQSLAVPYFRSGLAILVSRKNAMVATLDDLAGLRVAAVAGSTEYRIVQQPGTVMVVEVQSYGECVERVLQGRADAAVLDLPGALFAEKRNPDRLIVAPKPFEEEWYGVYMKKENKGLFLEIRRAVRSLRNDGVLDELYRKWF